MVKANCISCANLSLECPGGIVLLAGGYSGPTESIVVAYSPFEATALFWIAEDQQYFRENGLDLTLRKYDSGSASLTGVLNGEADILVGLSEFPVVRMAFQKERTAIIGNTDRGEFVYLVGRRDRGITSVADLKGKRIGTSMLPAGRKPPANWGVYNRASVHERSLAVSQNKGRH